jgi:hypothetical protein
MRNNKGQFVKGNIAWLKGTKGLIKAWNKGVKMPQITEEKHGGWKGDKVSVKGIHMWLKAKHPKPEKCEECGKIGESVNGRWTIEWALIHGKNYERNKDNFRHLCRACHADYDLTGRPNKYKGIKGIRKATPGSFKKGHKQSAHWYEVMHNQTWNRKD